MNLPSTPRPSPETLPFRTRLRLRWRRHRKPAIISLVFLLWLGALTVKMPALIELVEQDPAAAGLVVGFCALASAVLAWSLAE